MGTKYFKEKAFAEVKEKYPNINSDVVIDDDSGCLEFYNEDKIIIKDILIDYNEEEVLRHLFSKLNYINYLNKDIKMNINLYNKYQDFFKIYYECQVTSEEVTMKLKNNLIRRYVSVGKFRTGKLNNICDVSGVKVGHFSINEGAIHTGITVIIPHPGNIFQEKVLGATYVYNGFGKSIGLVQVDELGTVETPILLTNTLNVGKVADGLVQYVLDNNPEIGITTGTVNPIVMECNDSKLNDIRHRVLDEKSVYEAINNSRNDFLQGNIGAGSGMTCHGFKGGIGSSSRIVNIKGTNYTIGVLVNSNFLGGSPRNLIINNHFVGDELLEAVEEKDQGSIIIVVATDMPLSERQLKRVCKRAVFGINKTGGFAGNGSGDIVIGFTTANTISHFPKDATVNIKTIHDEYIDSTFKAIVDATEEAILNSLFYSKTTVGVRNNVAKSINEYIEVFDELLIEDNLSR